MTKLAIGSLVVGLVAAAISLPYLIPAVQEINRNTAQLKELNDERDSAQTVQPASEVPVASNDTAAPGIAEPALAKAPEPAPPAVAGPISTGIAQAHAKKPEPPLPGAGASVDVGGAPSCADLSDLKQGVNPTPRGTPYEGQLRWAFSKRTGSHPCTRGRTFSNTGESRSTGTLPPGEYKLAYGTLTVLPRR